ncbi:hypothetical protein JOB18_000438 [Solea senegalensis]|uniref:Secreted protein n=1 Tax=Solea senegalensis TaxID=28829 RepID=A0AAV6RJD6_SOLSE|nr:hypothetical protein JOB18_000438 [Solea senegalensis]
MDKRYLLVLLSLQVVLLLTTCASTDAAVPVRERERQAHTRRGPPKTALRSKRPHLNVGCWRKHGACGILPRPPPPKPKGTQSTSM